MLARNDAYWGGKPEIGEVLFKTVKEEAARVAGLLAGQADVVSNLPIAQYYAIDVDKWGFSDAVGNLEEQYGDDE